MNDNEGPDDDSKKKFDRERRNLLLISCALFISTQYQLGLGQFVYKYFGNTQATGNLPTQRWANLPDVLTLVAIYCLVRFFQTAYDQDLYKTCVPKFKEQVLSLRTEYAVRLVKAKCKARGWTITAVKEPFVSLNLELVVQHDVSFWIEISKPDGKTDKYEEHVHLPQTAKISLYAASRVGLLTTFGTEYVLPPVFCVAMILCRVLA